MRDTVLLVQPGNKAMKPRIPINLLPLAYTLRGAGFRPKIVDLRLKEFDEFGIDWGRVLMVGISAYTGPMILKALEAAKAVKAVGKEIPIVWGGIHASIMPEQTAEHELVDFVVRGDGEETIVALAKAVQKKKGFGLVKGITYKKNGEVVSNPDRRWFDLNKIPIMPYELVDMKQYNLAEFPLCTSRGCPYGCIFCYNRVYNKQSYRAKEAKLVVDEIEYVAKEFGVKTFAFSDDNFFTNKARVEQICRGIIKRKLGIKWISTIRADYLARYSDEFMRVLKDSGCYMVAFGAESGNDRVLKVINKGTTVKDNVEAVKKMKKFGIQGRISFVWGTPTETYGESIDSLELIKKFREIYPGVIVNGFFASTAYPNTPLFEKVRKLVPGFKIPEDLEGWGHWMHYTSGFQPWLDKSYVDKMTTASEIVRFRCFRDLEAGHYFKNKAVVLAIKGVLALMNIPASIRWKFNWYKFGIEWKIFNKLKFYFLGIV